LQARFEESAPEKLLVHELVLAKELISTWMGTLREDQELVLLRNSALSDLVQYSAAVLTYFCGHENDSD
jgi:hypothetical protein